MIKKVMTAIAVMAILATVVVATLVYHYDYVPTNPRDGVTRFWTSGTGFVTLTDRDTLAANGSVTSVDIRLGKGVTSGEFRLPGVKEGESIPSDIYLVGDYVKPATYPTPCVDSLKIEYFWVDGAGNDMKLAGQDTVKIDTTGLVSATALTGHIPFLCKLTPTESEANAFIGATMRFKVTILDLAPANDTLLLQNCGILRRFTN